MSVRTAAVDADGHAQRTDNSNAERSNYSSPERSAPVIDHVPGALHLGPIDETERHHYSGVAPI